MSDSEDEGASIDFREVEAEESDEDEEELQGSKKRRSSKIQDSSEEEDDEAMDTYEKDGFLVDDVEEEEEEEIEARSRKRPRPFRDDDDDDDLLFNQKSRLDLEQEEVAKDFEDDQDPIEEADEAEEYGYDDEEMDFGSRFVGLPSEALRIFGSHPDDYYDRIDRGTGKKSKSRNEDGSEDEMEDDEDEEDEEGTEGNIKDAYEPFVLLENFMTDEDQVIMDLDVPERLQYKISGRPSVSEDELHQEALWISARLGKPAQFRVVQKILELLYVEKLDLPFIKTYHLDLYKDFLSELDLWDIWEHDDVWTRLSSFHSLLLSALDHPSCLDLFSSDLLSSLKSSLSPSADDYPLPLDQLNDFRLFINLRTGLDIKTPPLPQMNISLLDKLTPPTPTTSSNTSTTSSSIFFSEGDSLDDISSSQMLFSQAGGEEGQNKETGGFVRTLYKMAKDNHILDLAETFTLPVADFAESIATKSRVKPPSPEQSVEDKAWDFVSTKYKDDREVLEICRRVLVREICAFPAIRSNLRDFLTAYGFISVSVPLPPSSSSSLYLPPITPEQQNLIDRLDNMEINSLQDHESLPYILDLLEAQKRGQIEWELRLREGGKEELELFVDYYLSGDSAKIVQEWDEERRKIVKTALDRLIPELTKEAVIYLRDRAQFMVARNVKREFLQVASTAGILSSRSGRKSKDITFREKMQISFPSVLSLVWDDPKMPVHLCVLDKKGSVLKSTVLSFLGNFKDSEAQSIPEKRAIDSNFSTISELVSKHSVEVIAVGALGMHAKWLKDQLTERIRPPSSTSPRIEFVFTDTKLARVAAMSSGYQRAFNGYSFTDRSAIAQGRFIQEPLIQLCGICNVLDDYSTMVFDERQHLLPRNEIMRIFQNVLVDVVNAVGVDFVFAVQNTYANALLHFVSGLGPRKATQLMRSIELNGEIHSRMTLADQLSSKIYDNSVAFFRFPRSQNVSDYTRVHPSHLSMAIQMSRAANDDQQSRSSRLVFVGEGITAESLDLVDLEKFSEEWVKAGNDSILHQLLSIREELHHPFRDPRAPFSALSPEKLFYLLSRESKKVLDVGFLIEVELNVAGRDDPLYGYLPSSVKVEIYTHEMPREMYRRGDFVLCRVERIDFHSFMVHAITDDQTVHAAIEQQRLRNMVKNEREALQNAEKEDDPHKKQLRHIYSPYFKAFNHQQAKEYLDPLPSGQVIFRPCSSFFETKINLSIKFHSVVQHLLITDLPGTTMGKKGPFVLTFDNINNFSIKSQFQDLPQIMAEFVEPLNHYMQMMEAHPYFLPLTDQEAIEKIVTEEFQKKKCLIYRFAVDPHHKLTYYIHFITGSKVRRSTVLLLPDGFRLVTEGSYFEKDGLQSIAHVQDRFKKNLKFLMSGGSSSSSSSSSAAPGSRPGSTAPYGSRPTSIPHSHHHHPSPAPPPSSFYDPHTAHAPRYPPFH
eukprot:TRINITY_DN1082_c0_g2_i1.p1 TRINITY_DN1082_c0_g2~~TRINITY_DN1082_c0_g2_i1.p1  ORF type:complete len:1441 (+),score=732.98 TRINITY_DN1082_c0_g2_i1:106-4428(+)